MWETRQLRLEADEPLAFGGHGALDEVEVVEGDAGAHGDAFEGVVGDVAGDADLLRGQAVEVAQERGAAGEDDAAVERRRRLAPAGCARGRSGRRRSRLAGHYPLGPGSHQIHAFEMVSASV